MLRNPLRWQAFAVASIFVVASDAEDDFSVHIPAQFCRSPILPSRRLGEAAARWRFDKAWPLTRGASCFRSPNVLVEVKPWDKSRMKKDAAKKIEIRILNRSEFWNIPLLSMAR